MRKQKRKVPKGKEEKRRFTSLTPIRWLILSAIFLGLLFWLVPRLFSLVARTWDSLFSLFGVGLALVAIAILVVGLAAWKRPLLLLRRWNRWLGGFAFALALMGLLSFFSADLGGSLIKSLVGVGDVREIALLVALFLLGVFLVFPRGAGRSLEKIVLGSWWLIAKTILWLGTLSRLVAQAVRARRRRQIALPVASAEPYAREKPPAPAPLPRVVPEQPKTLVTKVAPIMTKEVEATSSLTVGGWQLPPLDILDQVVGTALHESLRGLKKHMDQYDLEAAADQLKPLIEDLISMSS